MHSSMISEYDEEFLIKKKVMAVLEVVLLEIIFFISAWYFQWLYPSSYGWYSKLIMIFLGITGILSHRRIRNYGLFPKNIKFSIKWSIYILLLFLTIIITGIIAACIVGFWELKVNARLLLIDAIWFFIFVGFAEELFFRGYVQSRLNEVFTKKYRKIIGVDFEWHQGTLITGVVFFGLPHILVGINPLIRIYNISLAHIIIAAFASFLGIIFGIIREKTGGIIIVTILHGLIDFTVYGIGRIIGLMLSNIITIIALFFFFAVFFEKILKEPLSEQQ